MKLQYLALKLSVKFDLKILTELMKHCENIQNVDIQNNLGGHLIYETYNQKVCLEITDIWAFAAEPATEQEISSFFATNTVKKSATIKLERIEHTMSNWFIAAITENCLALESFETMGVEISPPSRIVNLIDTCVHMSRIKLQGYRRYSVVNPEDWSVVDNYVGMRDRYVYIERN